MIRIEDIVSPDFLKHLTIEELNTLAKDIRQFLIEHISKTGGHLSSNLGMVEMTIALHYCFNSPHDKLIFDVGHQSYTHKILTGRAKQFEYLRELEGISGFPRYQESIHDVYEVGHSSTSISAASGFLEAKRQGADIGEVISIIGDGSLQNGLSLSALNYLGTKTHQKAIIILNDNDMSISQNVGSLAKMFNKIRINRPFTTLKKMTPKFILRISSKFRQSVKSYIYGENFITGMGFEYIGPIDGHDIKKLIQYMNYAKNCKHSIMIHVKTTKGKGYRLSEEDHQGKWHSVGPFDITTGQPLKENPREIIAWSRAIANIVDDEMNHNEEIIGICPAMMYGSQLNELFENHHSRIIDVGIAEEHAVVMASAMAQAKMLPVVFMYSTFLQRSYDEIVHDIARSDSHVLFLVDRAGIVEGDGDTHQGIFDIAFLSHLPNMIIMMPRNTSEAKAMINYALHHNTHPIAIRYPKSDTNSKTTEIDFDLSWEIVKPISKINVITYGPSVDEFNQSQKSFGLINARVIKPLDLELLKKLNHTNVIVYEEVIENGSLGSMIAQAILANELDINLTCYAIKNYVPHGSYQKLRHQQGLEVEAILNKIK